MDVLVIDGTAEEMRKQARGNEIIKLGVAGGDINDVFDKDDGNRKC